MDIAITISDREIKPAVVNFFQYENQTVTLNFTLDSYMYGEVDLRNYKAYGVTSQNGLVDMTELEMNYDSAADKLVLSWEVQEYSLRQEGAITYQICFKENADDGENTAVFYTYKGIMINRGSVDGDNHITANYPTILKQWLDKIQELAGTLEAGIVYIPYGESVPVSDRLAGRVYFQFTDAYNIGGRFEDHEGKELKLNDYLPLSGGKMSGIIESNCYWAMRNGSGQSALRLQHLNEGSFLSLEENHFTLDANDGTTHKYFVGKADGSLQWDSKNVVRSVNNTQANQSGNVTVDVGVTSVNGKNGAVTAADTGCLPLTGGTLTGAVNMSSKSLSGVSSIDLKPSSTAGNGGLVDFHYNGSSEDYTSRIIEDAQGKVNIIAPNGFTVNDKHLVRSVDGVLPDNSGNVVSNAVKVTGDQTIGGDKNFTGNITINDDPVVTCSSAGTILNKGTTIIRQEATDSYTQIFGGDTFLNGAYVRLNGKDEASGGGFVLSTGDGSANKSLTGKPDGTLTWNGKSLLTPTGSVLAFAGSTAPSGFLICDGSAVSRTTYADLFKVIGTTYGTGNGSTTFNLPNYSSARMVTSATVAVKGNGMSLGFTNGTQNAGLRQATFVQSDQTRYGKNVGTSFTSGSALPDSNYTIGVTTDSTKSGITGTASLASSCKFIIKY